MINQIIRYSPIIEYIKNHHLHSHENKILEIGSGSQGLGKFYDINFDGVDETTSDYGISEKTTNNNMNFIKGNACNLPFPDNSYDFVFSLDMIEHIPDDMKKKAFEEAIRVGRKKIIFAFPCGKYARAFDYSFYNILKFLKRGKTPTGWLQEHYDIGLPDEKQISELLSQIEKKYHIEYKEFGNANIFMRSIVILFEYLLLMLKCGNLVEYLGQMIAKLNLKYNSSIAYRKFYIITKKYE